MDGWENYKGKRVFVSLKNGRKYVGEVIEVERHNHTSIFITILDKKGKRVSFVKSEIKIIQEEDEQ